MTSRAYGLLVLTALIWAGNSVAGKIGVGHIDPILLTSLRWIAAVAVIIPLSFRRLRADWAMVRQNWPLLIGSGVVGFGLFNMLLYTALNHANVVNVMIEQAGIPILIFAGNFVLFRTRATVLQLSGYVLTLIGVAVTAAQGELARLLGLQLNIGDALMLLAVVLYAGYTVTLRWKPNIHWQSLLAVQAVGGLLACVPFFGWHYAHVPLVMPDATGWGVVVYAALFPSLVAAAAYIAGVELIGANRAGIFINLLPIFGVLLSVVILRAPLHGYHFVAIALVCAGIVLSERGRALAVR